jgi:hypothetical protein
MINTKELVAKGVALLDEKGPDDWRDRVRWQSLYMYSGTGCVLGQVYGKYWAGVKALGISEYEFEGSEYGFCIHDSDNDDYANLSGHEEYLLLHTEWVRVLTESAVVVPDTTAELTEVYELIGAGND